MPSLPSRHGPDRDRTGAATTVQASVLRLRRFRDVPAFMSAALRLQGAFADSPGAIEMSLRAAPLRRTFWTLSHWRSDADLRGFVAHPSHLDVMRRFRPAMRSSNFITWHSTDDLPPTWNDAALRLLPMASRPTLIRWNSEPERFELAAGRASWAAGRASFNAQTRRRSAKSNGLVEGSGDRAAQTPDDRRRALDQDSVARPIIATKLYVPKRRRGLVARPRLRERLRVDADVRLVLVSAPAGFGKTTLLTEWFDETSEDGTGVAWISLDPSDSEPTMFWACVVSALETVVTLEPTVRELLDTSPFPTELMIATLVNELVVSTDDVWLVLDDFHAVDNRDIVQGIAALLDRVPSHVHVVISTRVDPDLPLPRWRVRGELVEIRAADLRFTADEAAAYLNDVAGLGLAEEDVAVLEQRTEGWVAALQLAALSIRGHEDVRGFISRFAGNDRYIVDYLVEEVLQRQPAEVREFLSQSSVLDRLSGPLCDAVTGGQGGREMLEALERANLFVVSLDDRREWYRYHHLFADALRARMLNDDPERRRGRPSACERVVRTTRPDRRRRSPRHRRS